MKMSKESTDLMKKVENTFGSDIKKQVEKLLFLEPIKAVRILPSIIIKAAYGYDPYAFIYQNNYNKSYFVLQRADLLQLEDTINIDLLGFEFNQEEQKLVIKKQSIPHWTPSTFIKEYSLINARETLCLLKSCKEYLNCLSEFSDTFRFVNNL